MNSKNIHHTNEESILIYSKNKLINIKSHYFLQKIFEHIPKKISLGIINYNKTLQQRLNTNINDYKDYSEKYSSIEIEVLPIKNKYGNFIDIDYRFQKYFHIYFNNNKNEEIKKKTFLGRDHKITKINIIIDYQVDSFTRLFKDCFNIESIYFKRFNRNNITDMSFMFFGCSSLKELNLSNFNTINVKNMSYMFLGCSALEKLNVSNFNTNKVTLMDYMFYECSSLKELNLSNFNTNNVIDMHGMFCWCTSLEKLYLSNFNTSKVKYKKGMFYNCVSIKEIKLPNFSTNNVKDMAKIFKDCLKEAKIRKTKKF